jgi:hypothetical protein
MNRLAFALLWLGALALVAVACGRYGSVRRPERAAAAAESVPVTDPAVPR